jgi:hypothetical protein
VRLQLMRSLALPAAALAALALASAARADDVIGVKAEYFVEPAQGQALHVFHPQVGANIDAHRDFSLNFAYESDVVSGATPRIYGSMDAISSATQFSDVRHAFHGGAELRLGPAAVGAGYTYAFENDYRSHAIDAQARVDLWGKNSTVTLGYAHNFDSVCDANNAGAQPLDRRALGSSKGCFDPKTVGLTVEPLAIDSYAVSFRQVLSPILLGELGVSFQVLDGLQSNPYRLVRLFGTVVAQESEPTLRQRVAVQARMRIAVPRARGAVGVDGRFYWDTWGVKSGTAEISWEEWVHPQILLRLRGRFYQQTRALFYRDAGEPLSYEQVGPVGQYFTGDRELSPFRDFLTGFKLAWVRNADERGKVWRAFETLDLNVKLDMMKYDPLTPDPPNQPRTVGLVNALIAQLGLSLRW